MTNIQIQVNNVTNVCTKPHECSRGMGDFFPEEFDERAEEEN